MKPVKDYRQLTNQEEVELLECVKVLQQYDSYLDRGSARVVYLLDPYQEESHADALKIAGLPCDRSYVIKVALGVGGMNQNGREVNSFLQYGNNYPLAQIFRSGKFVEIMEYVEPIAEEYRDASPYDFECLEDFYDELNNVADAYHEFLCDLDSEEEDPDDFTFNDMNATFKKREVTEVWHALCELADLFGETSDNTQLGYNNDGELVCYDYGFMCGTSDWHSSCGNILREHLKEYFNLCIESLEIEDDFIVLEEDFVKTLS